MNPEMKINEVFKNVQEVTPWNQIAESAWNPATSNPE
jgi:hypothetical protein